MASESCYYRRESLGTDVNRSLHLDKIIRSCCSFQETDGQQVGDNKPHLSNAGTAKGTVVKRRRCWFKITERKTDMLRFLTEMAHNAILIPFSSSFVLFNPKKLACCVFRSFPFLLTG